MSLFVDMHQYGRINQAQSDAATAKNKAEQFDARIADLERRADRLALACQALWETLRESTGMTDEQIYRRMAEIDRRDGQADGRIGSQVMNCAKCGRPINTSRPQCIYCGTTTATDHIVR